MGYLFAGQEVEEDVGDLDPVVELDAVGFQVGDQREDQGLVLVVLGELQRREVGQAADVVEEPLQIQLHLQGGVPFLKGKHGLPVEPEVGLVEFLVQDVVDGLAVEGFVRREEQSHELHRGFVAQVEAVFGIGALAPGQSSPVFGEVGIVLVEPVEFVQHAGALNLQRGDGPVQVPEALVVVFHLPAAPDDEAQVRDAEPVAGAAGEGRLLQNVDVVAGHLSVPDQKRGGGQAGKAGADEPGGFRVNALGLAGVCKGFIVSIGIVHIRTS